MSFQPITVLSEQTVVSLQQYAYSPDRDRPRFGDPLEQIIAASSFSWLERALLAGHLPDWDDLLLALRATHAYFQDEARDAANSDASRDALMWLDSQLFRQLLATLAGFIAELEAETATILRAETSSDPRLQKLWEQDAVAADKRALHALTIQQTSQDENRQLALSRDRYRKLQLA